MNLTKEQEIKFKKLGISSCSELALITPHSYEDLRLYKNIKENSYQLIDASIESVYSTRNSIQITFYAHNFSSNISGVVFRPKPYMAHQYKRGDRAYFYGQIDSLKTMSMPKKIGKIGFIIPKYKTKIRSDSIHKLIQSCLNQQSLAQEGIEDDIVKSILSIHFVGNANISLTELSADKIQALKYVELFIYMKKLSQKRRYFNALYSVKTDYKEWINSLPFRLTKEQINAIEDIQNDLSKNISAKRMIVGDVGSGKTMVILASAFMMMPYRSILMAPTTILANQLFEEAIKFLPNLKVVLVTNRQKKQNLEEFDFIIGTHALLHRDLPDTGLVIVDEQHRFGTLQRNKLEKLVSKGDKKPHFLQFSATPIPRTQAMIETAHIDVSLITSTPFKKDISSKIIYRNDFSFLLQHIREEIEKSNQVLIVYPLVEQSEFLDYQSIEEARGYWEKNFENVYVTHGKDKEKENTLVEFRDKGSLLISTTVVEVGISLPRLTTVVIVGAERLGLSSLHQLRGRVSRTGLKGYCFLYTNTKEIKRLSEFVKIQSGFDIANLDLKFRKSGDLLKGTNQSGMEFKWIDLSKDIDIVRRVKKKVCR